MRPVDYINKQGPLMIQIIVDGSISRSKKVAVPYDSGLAHVLSSPCTNSKGRVVSTRTS